MRNIRNCKGMNLATGKSECQVEPGKIKAIILVPHGKTLGTSFTPGCFETKCHADVPDRIYPIKTIVEYAKNGGEPQVSAVGYGGNGVTGISARTDTFTLDQYNDNLAASITENMNKKFDAYYLDENNILFGQNNGTEALGGIPMSTVYCTATPHPTSSAKATLTVSCCLEDARKALELFDYVQLDFNPIDELNGLVDVDLVEVESGKWVVTESHGGLDRTEELGPAIVTAATTVVDGVTAVAMSGNKLALTISNDATPALKKSSVLLANHIAGVKYRKTVKLATA